MVARGSYQAAEVKVRAWKLGERRGFEIEKEGKVKGEEKRGESRSTTFCRERRGVVEEKRKIKCISRKSPPSSTVAFGVVAGVLSNTVNHMGFNLFVVSLSILYRVIIRFGAVLTKSTVGLNHLAHHMIREHKASRPWSLEAIKD